MKINKFNNKGLRHGPWKFLEYRTTWKGSYVDGMFNDTWKGYNSKRKEFYVMFFVLGVHEGEKIIAEL